MEKKFKITKVVIPDCVFEVGKEYDEGVGGQKRVVKEIILVPNYFKEMTVLFEDGTFRSFFGQESFQSFGTYVEL